MDAGIVDDDLYRPRLQQRINRLARGFAIGDIESHRLGAATGCTNVGNHCFGARQVCIRMHDDMQAFRGQSTADGTAQVLSLIHI